MGTVSLQVAISAESAESNAPHFEPAQSLPDFIYQNVIIITAIIVITAPLPLIGKKALSSPFLTKRADPMCVHTTKLAQMRRQLGYLTSRPFLL